MKDLFSTVFWISNHGGAKNILDLGDPIAFAIFEPTKARARDDKKWQFLQINLGITDITKKFL